MLEGCDALAVAACDAVEPGLRACVCVNACVDVDEDAWLTVDDDDCEIM